MGFKERFGQDPNQPLFILDGFETTLQTIMDLSMDRVASVTILKDAASTAIYGAKAANGVVVVETKAPTAGRLRLSYNGSYDISFADLLARLPERPDLKIAQSKRRASEADLKLQRALAFPEVSLKGSYDKAGNFINDYWAIGLSISLPIFNRNQGNIKAAKLAILQSGQQEAYEQQQAENELYTCYARTRPGHPPLPFVRPLTRRRFLQDTRRRKSKLPTERHQFAGVYRLL